MTAASGGGGGRAERAPGDAGAETGAEALPEGAERIGWAYAAADEPARAEARFDAWADDYDRDVADLLGWRAPEEALPFALRHVPRDARIFDAGAGTGLVGRLLAPRGYPPIDGGDISRRMLEIAAASGAYAQILQIDLQAPLPIADATYDAVLCVGASGYMGPDALEEFARVLRPGGVILFTCGIETYDARFAAWARARAAAGRLETLETGAPFQAIPRSEPDHLARAHVWRVS
ncbi:MAG: class I SAM-dependent methyltransferase [Pseudomonadota bacterium]